MYANSSGSMIGNDAPWASSTRAHSEPAAANALQQGVAEDEPHRSDGEVADAQAVGDLGTHRAS